MSNKFNSSSLSEYSKSYARRLAGDFFAGHTTISGQELLGLSSVKQVNLFVVSSLSDKWRADAERFRSPYFDFEHPEVRQALQGFMNVVSQHISVRREHLEPLLSDATKRTLLLLYDPRYYFDEALRNQPDFMLSAESARLLTRYTVINRFIPAAIEERMKGKDFVYVNQALNWLDEVLTQRGRELEKPDAYVALFSEKVPLDPAVLLRKAPLDIPPIAPAATKSFFDTELEPVSTPAPPAAPSYPPVPDAGAEKSPGSGPIPPVSSEGGTSESPRFINGSHSVTPVAPSMQPSPLTGREVQSPVVAHSEPAAGPPSFGESLSKAPIESIAKSIPLNQKFMFINQLFNGNASSYNQAIDELDRATSYEQARDLVSYRYATQYLWDMSSDEVSMLIDVLKRRFTK